MSDWSEACDPVPARQEMTESDKARRARYWANERKRQWCRPGTEAPSAYRVDPDFERMGT